jgi:hypothetical protein
VTWVIALPGFPTRGILVSDVRITLSDPRGLQPDREKEGVRKVYAVAPNIAMGFSGNIDAGLKMVSDFGVMMRRSIPPGHATYEPSRAIFKWVRRARHHWAKTMPKRERIGGCSLAIVAALPPSGPFTPTIGYTLHAPDFEPIKIPSGQARSIGSGAYVTQYAAALEELATDDPELLQFETMYWEHAGGAGMAVSTAISEAIDKLTVPGISPHLHICSVRFGEIGIGTNDRIALTPGVPSRQMPPVVESWDAWGKWKEEHGVASELALGASLATGLLQ